MKKALKITGKICSYVLITSLLVIALITLLSTFGIPKNAQIYVVETGSMEPNLTTGSLVFVSPQSDYEKGDIITYKSNLGEPASPKIYNVTHRISNITGKNGDTFYETKGDANSGPDPWTANKLDVLGKVNFNLPVIGYVIGFAKTKIGFIFLILMPAILIVILEALNISKELNENKRKKNKAGLHFQ